MDFIERRLRVWKCVLPGCTTDAAAPRLHINAGNRSQKSLHQITISQHRSFHPSTMKQTLLIAAGASGAFAASLSDICNVDYITDSLPSGDSAIQGLVYGDVTTQPVYNSSVEAGNNYPASTGNNFCNVTVAYSHASKDDAVSA
jgi:hypothetical protein